MDGEAVYSGEGTTADTCKPLLKAECAMNEVLRDPRHGGESLQDDMRKEFSYVLENHTIVKQLYSHLSFKGKALTGMGLYAASIGVAWHQLHYLFGIRMIESA